MADDVWHRVLGSHSSCCGVHVLTAVRNPRETTEHGHLSFYGHGGVDDMPFNTGWRASEFDHTKFDEALDAVPNLTYNSGWNYRFQTSSPKAGMQVLRFVALGSELPDGFTVLAENSHGKLIGRVA